MEKENHIESKMTTILRESFKLFLYRGYDGVSLSRIEQAANTTRGVLFHYFKNKEDLFNKVAEQFIRVFVQETTLDKVCEKNKTPLKSYIEINLSMIQNRMDSFLQDSESRITSASFMRFVLYLKDYYEPWSEFERTYQERKTLEWTKVIELAKERGEISADVETDYLAEEFESSYFGLAFRGALIDKLSIPKLQRLWEYIYRRSKS